MPFLDEKPLLKRLLPARFALDSGLTDLCKKIGCAQLEVEREAPQGRGSPVPSGLSHDLKTFSGGKKSSNWFR